MLRSQVFFDDRCGKVEADLWLILIDFEGIPHLVIALLLGGVRRVCERFIAEQTLCVLKPHRRLHKVVIVICLDAGARRRRLITVLNQLASSRSS